MTYPSRRNVLGADSLGSLAHTDDPTGRDIDPVDTTPAHYFHTDGVAKRCTCDHPDWHTGLIR